MIVVNPDGAVHRHQKIDGEIVELKPLHFPDFVAPVNLVETVLHSIAYWIQTAREIGNPAEAVFEQGEAEDSVHTPFGLTAEEANQLFEFDSERIELRWNPSLKVSVFQGLLGRRTANGLHLRVLRTRASSSKQGAMARNCSN